MKNNISARTLNSVLKGGYKMTLLDLGFVLNPKTKLKIILFSRNNDYLATYKLTALELVSDSKFELDHFYFLDDVDVVTVYHNSGNMLISANLKDSHYERKSLV